MTGPKRLGNEIIEGSYHAHQVPLPAAATDDVQIAMLNDWLASYRPEELFKADGSPVDLVLELIPKKNEKLMGQRKETYAAYVPLKVAEWKEFALARGSEASCMLAIGELLDRIFVDNPTTARIFSPDELESNKLAAVFRHTNRDFQWDPATHARGGRVIEILSEHTCQGLLQGTHLTNN
jgi:xylulose-5-phosphate/fructose-6-phosphate phosphoketolase